MGDVAWSATFAGWEHVLVPAGYRLAARIDYDETVSTQLFGRPVTREAHTTFWYDPEINWWIKREQIESQAVRSLEAIAFDRP